MLNKQGKQAGKEMKDVELVNYLHVFETIGSIIKQKKFNATRKRRPRGLVSAV